MLSPSTMYVQRWEDQKVELGQAYWGVLFIKEYEYVEYAYPVMFNPLFSTPSRISRSGVFVGGGGGGKGEEKSCCM